MKLTKTKDREKLLFNKRRHKPPLNGGTVCKVGEAKSAGKGKELNISGLTLSHRSVPNCHVETKNIENKLMFLF